MNFEDNTSKYMPIAISTVTRELDLNVEFSTFFLTLKPSLGKRLTVTNRDVDFTFNWPHKHDCHSVNFHHNCLPCKYSN